MLWQRVGALLSALFFTACVWQHNALTLRAAGGGAVDQRLPLVWSLRPSCAIPAASALRVTSERYLVYAPQFGHSNQLVSLRNAVVYSILLNRSLVLPHLLSHVGVWPSAAFGGAFDVRRAALPSLLHPLRVVEMDDFLRRDIRPAALLDLATATRFANTTDAYFASLGSGWQQLPHRRVPLPSFTPEAIRLALGRCDEHEVLAFRSLFGALELRPYASRAPKAGSFLAAIGWERSSALTVSMGSWSARHHAWVDRQAMPALLAPLPALEAVADAIGRYVRRGGREFGCLHVRRGDFEAECRRYVDEMRSREPRGWVLSHFSRGWGCWQGDAAIALNLRRVHTLAEASGLRAVGFFAMTEDDDILNAAALQPFNLLSSRRALAEMRSIGALRTNSSHSTVAGPTPWDILAQLDTSLPHDLLFVLIDQLVCSRARVLLLNAFSTFSQMVLARIGLTHPDVLGWVRDITSSQQQDVGIELQYYRRVNPFDEETLL